MLEVAALSHFYGKHQALADIGLRAASGEIVAILGANGAGKSTLLKIIAGLIRPAPGAIIRFEGTSLAELPAHQIVERGIALVPEGRGIFGELTVAENLQLGAYPARARKGETEMRAKVLALFPRLNERMSQAVRTMSGGEQQMVAIGRALMSNPMLLMLDEPSLGLAPVMTDVTFEKIGEIHKLGTAILLVEQNVSRALSLVARAYVLESGRVIMHGTSQELSGNKQVQAAYLGI